jgi:SAM-dependent methyltransferase
MKNKNNLGSLGDQYGDRYLKWKDWGGFGTLKKSEEAYFKAEIERTNCRFPEKSKILEIGFGNGKFLKYAFEKGWDVIGTEVNSALVDIAQEAGYVAIHTDNLSNFNDDTFDLIVAFDVLEHIEQYLIPIFISEIKRVLKAGGYFIARFPNGDSPFGLINQNGDVTHITVIRKRKSSLLWQKFWYGSCICWWRGSTFIWN